MVLRGLSILRLCLADYQNTLIEVADADLLTRADNARGCCRDRLHPSAEAFLNGLLVRVSKQHLPHLRNQLGWDVGFEDDGLLVVCLHILQP